MPRQSGVGLRAGRLVALAVCASLWGAPAQASEPQKGKGVEGPGSAGGGSGPGGGSAEGPGSGATATAGLRADVAGVATMGGLIDHLPGTRGKWWDVGASWETHGLLWRTNTNCGRCKLFNYASVYAGLNLTRNDRLRARIGMYEWLIADPGETGLRATDLNISYRHVFRLPWELTLRATAAVSLPTGFYSQLTTQVVAPSLGLALARSYRGLTVELSGFSAYFVVGDGAPHGNSNTQALVSGSFDISYSFWFHPALELGVDGYTGFAWHYFAPPGQARTPPLQAYGGEIYLRYAPPVIKGIHTEITVALADGDPTLGYGLRNHDGINHLYLNYYSSLEAYGALAVRY